jgi:hypothetical protein
MSRYLAQAWIFLSRHSGMFKLSHGRILRTFPMAVSHTVSTKIHFAGFKVSLDACRISSKIFARTHKSSNLLMAAPMSSAQALMAADEY